MARKMTMLILGAVMTATALQQAQAGPPMYTVTPADSGDPVDLRPDSPGSKRWVPFRWEPFRFTSSGKPVGGHFTGGYFAEAPKPLDSVNQFNGSSLQSNQSNPGGYNGAFPQPESWHNDDVRDTFNNLGDGTGPTITWTMPSDSTIGIQSDYSYDR